PNSVHQPQRGAAAAKDVPKEVQPAECDEHSHCKTPIEGLPSGPVPRKLKQAEKIEDYHKAGLRSHLSQMKSYRGDANPTNICSQAQSGRGFFMPLDPSGCAGCERIRHGLLFSGRSRFNAWWNHAFWPVSFRASPCRVWSRMAGR